MNKIYFAKFIPVEEKINEGDIIIYSKLLNHFPIKWLGGDLIGTEKKVKLFLCSRDIKEGNKVYGTILNGDNIYINSNAPGYNFKEDRHYISLDEAILMKAYNVVGEISPEAIWVKEGMQFDENEIKIIWGSKVRKEFRNGERIDILLFTHYPKEWEIQDQAERWAENDPAGQNYGYEWFWNEEPPFIKHVQILGPCGHFH